MTFYLKNVIKIVDYFKICKKILFKKKHKIKINIHTNFVFIRNTNKDILHRC